MSFENFTTPTPTSLGSWALLVAKAIDSYGLNSEQIFKQAGVALADINKPNARFPTALMVKVWKIAVEQSNDPYIAIRVAKFFKPTAYSALGMAMASSLHVYDALKRATRYSRIISDGSTSSLEETEQDVAFVLRSRPDLRSLTHIYGMSATLCSLFNILRDVAGDTLKIKEVHFEHELESTQPFEDFFGCPIYYQADCNKIVFDKESAYCQQAFSNSQIAGSLDEWIEEYLSKLQEDRVVTRVQKYLLKHLSYGDLDQTKVAKGLAMSTRMLQRKLQEEGTIYTAVLDDCREKLSIKLIQQKQLPLSEVAYMLGFSDQSNFTRAFKRWTGTTPLQYKG